MATDYVALYTQLISEEIAPLNSKVSTTFSFVAGSGEVSGGLGSGASGTGPGGTRLGPGGAAGRLGAAG